MDRKVKMIPVKCLAALLIAAALSVAACCKGDSGTGGLIFGNSSEATPYPVITPRPQDEIEKTGVTKEDVINTINYEFQDCLVAFYKDRRPGANVSVKFNCLRPDLSNAEQPDKVYFFAESYATNHQSDWEKVKPEKEYFNNIYAGSVNIELMVNGKTTSVDYVNIGMSQDSFEKMCDTFGYESAIVDWQYIEDHDLSPTFFGRKVYPGFEINEETINNATQEQLNAIYDVFKSLIDINIYGKDPNKQ